MRSESSHNTHTHGVIKDSIITILIFAAFYFIDVRVATFIAVICTAILLTRRIILDYNPGFINGHHIIYNERELIVPKGVDIFDLSKVPAISHLQRYVEVIRSIMSPPAVLIIRFCGILQIEEYDLLLLTEIIRRLYKSDITVILSDVGKNVRFQLKEFDLDQQLGDANICGNIDVAIIQADKVLHCHETK